jgi:hypothetical protein
MASPPLAALQVRLKRIETKILSLLSSTDDYTTEKYIRTQVGDNTGTGKALRRLVHRGRVLRYGKGGVGDPFRYHYGNDAGDKDSDEVLPAPDASRHAAAAAAAVSENGGEGAACGGGGGLIGGDSGKGCNGSKRATSAPVKQVAKEAAVARRSGVRGGGGRVEQGVESGKKRGRLVPQRLGHQPRAVGVATGLRRGMTCKKRAYEEDGYDDMTYSHSHSGTEEEDQEEEEEEEDGDAMRMSAVGGGAEEAAMTGGAAADDGSAVIAVAPFTPKWARKYRSSTGGGGGGGEGGDASGVGGSKAAGEQGNVCLPPHKRGGGAASSLRSRGGEGRLEGGRGREETEGLRRGRREVKGDLLEFESLRRGGRAVGEQRGLAIEVSGGKKQELRPAPVGVCIDDGLDAETSSPAAGGGGTPNLNLR